MIKQAKVGDYVVFGQYEQDNDTSNGKEDVEWLVLDVQEDRALLISKYLLDCKPYNTTDDHVTWETCTLRKWLNDEFINTAFSTLLDLGIGPKAGFAIMDKESKWSDYIEDWLQFNDVKTYIYLKVKLVFDPPQSSSVASSYASTVKELEWRICNRKDREGGDENE